jgi:hypothetical protein
VRRRLGFCPRSPFAYRTLAPRPSETPLIVAPAAYFSDRLLDRLPIQFGSFIIMIIGGGITMMTSTITLITIMITRTINSSMA